MAKDLTVSNLHRQNILNNRFAIERLGAELSFEGILFNGHLVFTKAQVAHILEVDERTIERYLSSNGEELTRNGYMLLIGDPLRKFKKISLTDIDVAQSTKALGIFTFRSVLNLAMLLTESERAREIRSRILDVAIEVITHKAGDTTYVNQRDADYLPAAFQEESYRKSFINAVTIYVEGAQWKYKHCINAVYKCIFQEHAREYRRILNLKSEDNVRDTFYAELLTMIASFEAGIPEVLRYAVEKKGKDLTIKEAVDTIHDFGKQPLFKPLIDDVRVKIASRDFTLRDAIHDKLEPYIQAMPEKDYERFLGEKSKALEKRIKETLDVYKRLKDR